MTQYNAVNDLFQRAFDAHRTGGLDAALGLYAQILAINPHHFDALHLTGVAQMQKNDPIQAVAFISRALLVDTRQQAAFSNRGVAHLSLKNYAAALSDFDQAIALKPDQAEAHYNRGKALFELSRGDDAMAAFDHAIELNRGYAEAHMMRGLVFAARGHHDKALSCYDRAIKLNPQAPDAHFNRGNALCELGEDAQAVESYAQALALWPNHVEAFNNRGNALRLLNRYDEALADYTKATALVPDFVGAQVNTAFCLLAMGRYAQGWEAYEWRFKTPELQSVISGVSQPRWHGPEPVVGKRILLVAEQGLGDTLQFCRFAPLLAARGATVSLVVPAALKTLLSGLPGIAAVYGEGETLPGFDFYCPLMSLPRAFKISVETIPAGPYLKADPVRSEAWRARLAHIKGLRVGLVWAGSSRKDLPAAHATDKKRSLPLAAFEPLGALPGINFFSLQKGEPSIQHAMLHAAGWAGPKLNDDTPELNDFADTAALVANLDLVISCDTSVVHLAGGMGKPVWILNRFNGCWRWLLNRTDSPWYPSARLFHQSSPGNWARVIANVKLELEGLLKQSSSR